MEDFLQHLPPKPQSMVARLAITTGFVALSFLVLVGLRQQSGVLGFYVLLPAIFAASLLFDRFAGIYGAVLSTAILYVFLTPEGSMLIPRELILPLVLFLLVGLAFAVISEALRTAWERAAAAERAKDLLLLELGHRTKNNLAMVISMLELQARLKSNPETRAALEKAVARIHAIASAHEYFRPLIDGGRVEMRSYLEKLCSHLGDVLREIRPIAVRVEAPEVYLAPDQAIPLGLIVNELVTNALKHAFPGDRAGTVDVILKRASALTLLVKDDGVGCPRDRREGMGSRLTRLLAQELGAHITWEPSDFGCQVRLVFRAGRGALRNDVAIDRMSQSAASTLTG